MFRVFIGAIQRLKRGGSIALIIVSAIGGTIAPACAQPDGSEHWIFRGERNDRFDSSPAIGADGTLYVGVRVETTPASGLLLALDRSGRLLWERRLPREVDSSPTVGHDGTVYVGCSDGKLYAINPNNGGIRWTFDTGDENVIYSTPVISADGGAIYVGTWNVLDEKRSALIAISLSTRAEIWRKPTGSYIESTPAVDVDGTIYFGSWDGFVYALRPNGTEKWRFDTHELVFTSPAIGPDGTIYIGSTANLWALTAEGAKKWNFSVASVIGGPSIGPDGTVYFGAFDAKLYALKPGETQPSLKWAFQSGGAIYSSPAVRADGTLIFGSDDGFIWGLNPADGSVKWNYSAIGRVRSSPVIAPADGSIYIGSQGNRFYALHGSRAVLSEYSSWPMHARDPSHSARATKRNTDARLVNLSTSGEAGGGKNLIVGFVVEGSTSKYYLVRAAGPILETFGIPNPLPDPTITLKISGAPDAFNNNWEDPALGPSMADTVTRVGAFPFSAGSKDAAVVARLGLGAYTALVGSADGRSGTALVEAYDGAMDAPASALLNLSARGHVGIGANVLIAGLVIRGTEPLRVLIRAIGPGLTQFDVSGVLAQPAMAIYSKQGVELYRNIGWTVGGRKGDLAGAATVAGAFPLSENHSDCAALLWLDPGEYTIQASGVNATMGEALVEVYVAR